MRILFVVLLILVQTCGAQGNEPAAVPDSAGTASLGADAIGRPIVYLYGYCSQSSEWITLHRYLALQLKATYPILYPDSTRYVGFYDGLSIKWAMIVDDGSEEGVVVAMSAPPRRQDNPRFFTLAYNASGVRNPVSPEAPWFEENDKTKVANVSIVNKAFELREILAEIQRITEAKDAIVIGHSMGGIVARSYIQGAANDNDVTSSLFGINYPALGYLPYQDNVAALITLDTPHGGIFEDSLDARGSVFACAGGSINKRELSRVAPLFFETELLSALNGKEFGENGALRPTFLPKIELYAAIASYWSGFSIFGDDLVDTELQTLGNSVLQAYLPQSQSVDLYNPVPKSLLVPGSGYSAACTLGPIPFLHSNKCLSLIPSTQQHVLDQVNNVRNGALLPLTITPDSGQFGSLNVGASGLQLFTVKNERKSAVSILVASPNNASFSQTNSCNGLPIPVGGKCDIEVRFSPTTAGTHSSTLTISDNSRGETYSVPLTGVGLSGHLSLDPMRLDFPSTKVGTGTSRLALALKNVGTGPIVLDSYNLSGDLGFYIDSTTCASPIQPSSTCSFDLSFSPFSNSPGVYNGQFNLNFTVGSAPQQSISVPLQGSGVDSTATPVFTVRTLGYEVGMELGQRIDQQADDPIVTFRCYVDPRGTSGVQANVRQRTAGSTGGFSGINNPNYIFPDTAARELAFVWAGPGTGNSYDYQCWAGINSPTPNREGEIRVAHIPSVPTIVSAAAEYLTLSQIRVTALINPNGHNTNAFLWVEPVTGDDYATSPIYVGSASVITPVVFTLNQAAQDIDVGAQNATSRKILTGVIGGGSPSPPAVTVANPTNIGKTTAVLNGSVSAGNSVATARFIWSKNSDLSGGFHVDLGSVAANTTIAVTAALTDLSPNTTYYCRLTASNLAGARDSTLSPCFTTAVQSLPQVTQVQATEVTHNTALLSAQVNPNGAATTVVFLYGADSGLANASSSPALPVGSGTVNTLAVFQLTALLPNTTYYFKTRATNSGGTQDSSIFNFKTTAPPSTYVLNINSSNPASGVGVTVSPLDNAAQGSASTPFTRTYNSATTVVLTAPATAANGNTFSSWSGCSTTTDLTCNVIMDSSKTVTATFNTAPVTYPLTVSKNGTGSGTVTSSPTGISCGSTCQASFASSTQVTLTPNASSGSTFAGWSGACVGAGSCTVTMDAAKTVTATFNTAPVTYALTVSKNGTGSGTVTSSPSGISCGSTCQASFASSTQVTLTPSAASGSTFAGWSGACVGAGSCTVTMDAAKTVTATFNTVPVSSIGALVKRSDFTQPDVARGYTPAGATTDNKIYLFGGKNSSDAFSNIIRRYDASANLWSVLTSTMPYAYAVNESHNAAIASNGKIYLGPGNGPGGNGQHNKIIEFDPATGVAIERASIVTSGNIWGIAVAPAPASPGGVYLFGGWNGGGIAAVRRYDPVTNQVLFVVNLSVGRTVGARIVHPNGKVYLFGGNTTASYSTVEVFDTSTATLATISNPTGLQFNHGTQGWVGDDGLIYLWNPPTGVITGANRIIRFNPANNSFEDFSAPPQPGGHFLAIVKAASGGSAYFFTHYATATTALPEVWALAPSSPPVAVISPSALSFANQLVNTSSAAQVVTITNTGAATLNLASITASGDFARTTTCSTTLAAGASCTVSVTFTPTASGVRSGTLAITHNAAGSPTTVSLSGTGYQISPPTLISPANGSTVSSGNVTFSWTSVPGAASYMFVIGTTNPPLNEVPINSPATSFSVATSTIGPLGQFKYYWFVTAFSGPNQTGSSGSSPISSFTVVFPGQVGLSAASLTFGVQLATTKSAPKFVTLTNTGQGPLSLQSIQLTGNAFVSESSTCPASLASAASCQIAVAFRPLTQGTATGSLVITSNSPGSPHVVALSGPGIDVVFNLVRPKRSSRSGSSQGQAQTYALVISPPADFSGIVRLGCANVPAAVTCRVTPQAVQLSGQPVSVDVTVTPARRSQRLRSRPATSTYMLKINAEINGAVRSIDLPVTVER